MFLQYQQIRSHLTKLAFFKAGLTLYIILSAAYILLTQCQTYQVQLMQQSFLQGQRATIEELIEQAESACQPFPVFTEEKEVTLVNLACLEVAAETNTQETTVPDYEDASPSGHLTSSP